MSSTAATLPERLRRSTMWMANTCSVPMEIWCEHSDAALEAASVLEAQLAGHKLSAKQATKHLLRANELERAGKHLAVKLAEVYRAAGADPADCQAMRDWMAALTKATA